MAAGLRARAEPVVATPEEVRKIYRRLDIVVAVILVLLFMALFHIYDMLTVGDWDFWSDWKDKRWWIFVTPTVLMAMPAAAQYIFWEKFRLPFAATLLTFCLVLAQWINRFFNMYGWTYFPLNFVWPATLIPCGIALDVVLMLTNSYVLTAIIGGGLWGMLFYPVNWNLLLPFLQPVDLRGTLMSLADVQGFHYVRTGTPEYLRMIDRGTLRTFAENPALISMYFASFACMIVYTIGMFIGRAFANTQFSWFKRA